MSLRVTAPRRYLFIAIIIALFLHLSVFVLMSNQSMALEGDALHEGENGIDIGLGQQGSYANIKERLSKLVIADETLAKVEEKKSIAQKKETKKVSEKKNIKKTITVKKTLIEDIAIKKSALTSNSVKPREKDESELTEENERAEAQPKASPAAVMATIKTTGRAEDKNSGGKKGNAVSYINDINRWLLKHQRYPASAKKEKQEGTVRLAFTIDRNGHVLKRSIAESSGYPSLDQAALDMIDAASPLPAVPSDIFPNRETLPLVKPIDFKLITNTFF